MSKGLFRLFMLLASLAGAAGQSAPYTPVDDNQVLSRLPAGASRSQSNPLRPLQARWRSDPGDIDAALGLARAQIALARSESDPRFLGHAQATLGRWWGQRDAPAPVRLLRATIRQSNHEFGAALEDLDAVLRENPRDAQAWLTISTVQLVVGKIEEARQSCERLRTLTAPLVFATCAAAADSVNGRAAAALAALESAQPRAVGMPPAVLSWSATVAGEIAERLGRGYDAERQFRAALALDPEDTYARNALADFLLADGRADAARQVLPRDALKSDPTLLRVAIAARRTGDPQAAALEAALFSRLAASRERGEALHLREEARALLELRGDAGQALALAQQNWKTQKEIADARLLLGAAVAARDAAAADPILRWTREHHIEDVVLTSLGATAVAR